MLTTIAVIIMCLVFYKLGFVTLLAAILLLILKMILAIFVLIAGVFGWRCYRGRKPKQLPGGTYESDR